MTVGNTELSLAMLIGANSQTLWSDQPPKLRQAVETPFSPAYPPLRRALLQRPNFALRLFSMTSALSLHSCCTLLHFFALVKITTPLQSITSALLVKNRGDGGVSSKSEAKTSEAGSADERYSTATGTVTVPSRPLRLSRTANLTS